VVFKRRDRRSIWQALAHFAWPRGGWARAFYYVRHRLHRLPDAPHRIARGIFAGVFISFTPLFGAHFLGAAALAMVLRGNVIAALLATFVGNPITFPIIAISASKLGHWMLGSQFNEFHARTLGQKFMAAGHDLRHNFIAMFSEEKAHWGALQQFFLDVFLPYLVGGLIPGLIAGLVAYYLSVPLITAYQNRRRIQIKARLDKLKARLQARLEDRQDRP
jgi:uncharacterized protein (DUF2062 family)